MHSYIASYVLGICSCHQGDTHAASAWLEIQYSYFNYSLQQLRKQPPLSTYVEK